MGNVPSGLGKDPRCLDAGAFMRIGHISTYEEIFRIIPKTVVATDLAIKVDAFTKCLSTPLSCR
jgi:hypothetical protein